MTDTIAQLVARVEAASGPDRDLDARILCVVRGDDFDLMARVVPDFGEWYPLPAYTASLDAAMTLASDPALGLYGGPVGMLRWAIDRMQAAGQSIDALPRWIVAACLRAHDGGSNSL